MTEFNDTERESKAKQAAVDAALKHDDKMYEAGWNSALEMAAFKVEYEFQKSFGKDTLQSIAIYIRGMKK